MAEKKSLEPKVRKKDGEKTPRGIKRLASKRSKRSKAKSSNPAIRYLKGAWSEIRRVTWPDRKEATRLTVGVVIFSVAIAGIISLIDYGFGEAFQRILLGS